MESTFANLTPGAGVILGAHDAIQGEDSITHEPMSPLQRGLAFLGIGGAIAGALKSASLAGKVAKAADKVADCAPVRVTGQALADMRKAFTKAKPQAWIDEAAKNPSKYMSAQLEKMKQGLAPLGDDGFSMEIHHRIPLAEGGTNAFDNFVFLTQTQHRRGPNYKLNHPNLP